MFAIAAASKQKGPGVVTSAESGLATQSAAKRVSTGSIKGLRSQALTRSATSPWKSGGLYPANLSRKPNTNRRLSGIVLSKSETKTPSKGPFVEGSLHIQSILDGPADVMCVRFSPNGHLLAAGYADGSIKVFQADTDEYLYFLHGDETNGLQMPVTCIRFIGAKSADQTEKQHLLLATYTSGRIKFWHYPSQQCIYTINEMRISGQTLGAAVNCTGQHFVSIGADYMVYLYDIETKRRLNSLHASENPDVMDGHRDRVYAVTFHSSEPNIFLTGGWDNTVQYWDSRNKAAFRRFYGPHICGDALDLDPVYSHILTGSWRKENPLQIWDFSSGNKIADVPQHLNQVSMLYCAQFHGLENVVCGGTGNNLARLIDRTSFATIGQLNDLPQGVYCMDNDRKGANPRIAVGAAKSIYIVKTAL